MEPTRIKPASKPSGISEETWRGSGEPAALLLPANSLNQPLLSPTTYTPFSNFKGDETMPGSPIRSLYTHTHTHTQISIYKHVYRTERESEFHERSIVIIDTLETRRISKRIQGRDSKVRVRVSLDREETRRRPAAR